MEEEKREEKKKLREKLGKRKKKYKRKGKEIKLKKKGSKKREKKFRLRHTLKNCLGEENSAQNFMGGGGQKSNFIKNIYIDFFFLVFLVVGPLRSGYPP